MKQLHIDGMPLYAYRRAGLREASDEIERIGIDARAWQKLAAYRLWSITTTDAMIRQDLARFTTSPTNLYAGYHVTPWCAIKPITGET